MNNDDLNLAEKQIISRVDLVTGLIEERYEELLTGGVFAEYRKIFEAYVELINSDTEGLEALKRAIFLKWYEQAEPACFSGLYELPDGASQKIFESLEYRIKTNVLDSELKWMLFYYKESAEWIFFPYSDLSALQSYLANADFNSIDDANLTEEDFESRGMMGDYWQSFFRSNAGRFGSGKYTLLFDSGSRILSRF